MKRILVVLLFMVFPVIGMAATIHVPGDQPTIQAGIDAAMDGDTVLVAPDTYVENINFLGKAITVISEQGPEVTIIDGSEPEDPDLGSVVTFENDEGPDSVLEGFTLTNGSGTIQGSMNLGGGIHIKQSSPTITGNIITGNTCTGNSGGGGICAWFLSSPTITGNTVSENSAAVGGGLYCHTSSTMIADNTIIDNTAWESGGGINCGSCSVTITGNVISDNSAQELYGGGVFATGNFTGTVTNNIISGNNAVGGGGGITAWYSYTMDITNNLIIHNTTTAAGSQGGGIKCSNNSTVSIRNTTIYGNDAATNGGGVSCEFGSLMTISNTILWDNEAGTIAEEIFICSLANPSTVTIDYSDVRGGEDYIFVNPNCVLNWGVGMIEGDPLFCTGPGGDYCDYYLSQGPCQPCLVNPCVNAGDPASEMIEGTTRTDCHSDPGIIDMGYHYPLPVTVIADLSCEPDAGILPFSSQFSVTLGNAVACNRTVAGRLNLTLASGAAYQSWRAGYTNLGPNEMFITSWMQTLPALGSLVGANLLELHAEDVTPAPYNLPPYPPSGDTATASYVVTCVAP